MKVSEGGKGHLAMLSAWIPGGGWRPEWLRVQRPGPNPSSESFSNPALI